MDVQVAATRRARTRGLRGRDGLRPREALLIPRCRAIHTFGMRFPITVAYLDRQDRVREVVAMQPNRLGRPRFRARSVLECAIGTHLTIGQRIGVPDH